MKAIWNGRVIAESSDTVVVEGNHYFPRQSIKTEYFQDSDMKSHCPWKGDAAYWNVVVDGKVNADAAWHYDDPKDTAEELRERVAFWHGVEVVE